MRARSLLLPTTIFIPEISVPVWAVFYLPTVLSLLHTAPYPRCRTRPTRHSLPADADRPSAACFEFKRESSLRLLLSIYVSRKRTMIPTAKRESESGCRD